MKAFTIVSRVFRPEPVAVAIQLNSVVEALQSRGHRVQVLTSKPNTKDYRPEKHIRRWPVLRDSQGAVRGYLQYASFDIPVFFRLLFARNIGNVIVIPPPTTGFVVRIACFLRRTSYVYFADDLLTSAVAGTGASKTVVRVVKFLETFSLKGADQILTISEDVKTEINALLGQQHKIRVVGTGIDTNTFAFTGEIKKPAERYLLYTGTFSDIHGAQVFIKAFRQILPEYPDLKLLFYGQGTEETILKNYVDEHQLPVVFSGLIPSEQIAAIMRGAELGLASVRPGRGYDFAYATKAFAMMACGLPVVYAGVGPVKDILEEHQLGYVSDWEVQAVANNLRLALAQPKNQAQRKALAEFTVKNYSYTTVAETIVDSFI